jgi:hypothetical protein
MGEAAARVCLEPASFEEAIIMWRKAFPRKAINHISGGKSSQYDCGADSSHRNARDAELRREVGLEM